MSTVHALIIKNNKLSFHSAHYSKIISLISKSIPKKPIDAGYIIIDFDKNEIVSSQSAFSIKDIGKKEISEMILFNL